MKNIVSRLYRIQRFLLLATLLFSCTSSEMENNAGEPENTDGSESSDQIIISRQQFATAAMALGKLQEHSFGSSIKINGMIDVPPYGRAEISNYYGGYVRNLNLLTGQEIKKGELLFTLENPEYVQMQQDFLEIKSQLTYLRSDFERQQTLNEENIASRKNFLRAQSDYHTALARYEGLKKKLGLLNIKAEALTPENFSAYISVFAPVSGFVTEVNTVNGAFLSPADIAVKLINTDQLQLDLNVFEKNISTLRKGQSVRFWLPDEPNASFEAEVFMVGKAIDAANRMVNVHARLKDEQQKDLLVPGMYVEAEIYSSKVQSLALPSEALVEAAGGHYVLVKKGEADGRMIFEKVAVTPGATDQGMTEIINAEDFAAITEFLIKGAFNLISS